GGGETGRPLVEGLHEQQVSRGGPQADDEAGDEQREIGVQGFRPQGPPEKTQGARQVKSQKGVERRTAPGRAHFHQKAGHAEGDGAENRPEKPHDASFLSDGFSRNVQAPTYHMGSGLKRPGAASFKGRG